MTVLISDRKDIDKIINEKIKNKKLIFTDYYKFGILKKGIEHEKVIEIFQKFDLVYEIEKEILKYGDVGYELFYKLSNNTSFSIATCPKNKNLFIIHKFRRYS